MVCTSYAFLSYKKVWYLEGSWKGWNLSPGRKRESQGNDVGGENTRHFNNARPFWNKCLFRSMVWHSPTYSNDDILSTTIYQEPTMSH
jgi:hypothetical protein